MEEPNYASGSGNILKGEDDLLPPIDPVLEELLKRGRDAFREKRHESYYGSFGARASDFVVQHKIR